MNQPKILITGATGFLGWYLCNAAQQKWEVYGTTHSKSVQVPHTKSLAIDLTDAAALRSPESSARITKTKKFTQF